MCGGCWCRPIRVHTFHVIIHCFPTLYTFSTISRYTVFHYFASFHVMHSTFYTIPTHCFIFHCFISLLQHRTKSINRPSPCNRLNGFTLIISQLRGSNPHVCSTLVTYITLRQSFGFKLLSLHHVLKCPQL